MKAKLFYGFPVVIKAVFAVVAVVLAVLAVVNPENAAYFAFMAAGCAVAACGFAQRWGVPCRLRKFGTTVPSKRC